MVKLNADWIMNLAIAAIVGFTLFAAVLPDIQTAGQTVNDTGAPLATLFLPGGVVILLLMAGVVIAAVKLFKGGR